MYGKLGHGTEAGWSIPKKVEALNGISIVQVACGSRVNKGYIFVVINECPAAHDNLSIIY